MKRSLGLALFLFLPGLPLLLAQAAPDGTPERALQDLVLASKPEEIERHLPVATLDDAKTLDAEDRRAFESSLLWRQSMPGNQASVEIPEDGHAFLVMRNDDTPSAEVQLTESVVTGLDAVLRFAVGGPAPVPLEVMAWMRYEDGEWRIRELDTGYARSRVRFDDPEFVERFRNREQKANESSAISTLYNLHYALQRYSDTFPEVGIPDNLSVLGEPVPTTEEDSDVSDSVTFLNAEMAHNDSQSQGYQFHYQMLRGGPQGTYTITARPVDFGKNGRFSYLIDESGNIHQVAENRDATSDDPVPGEKLRGVSRVD